MCTNACRLLKGVETGESRIVTFKSYIHTKHRLKLQICRRVKNVNTVHHADQYMVL